MAFHGPARMVWRLVRKRCEIQAWYDGGDRARITGNGTLTPWSGAGRIVAQIETGRLSIQSSSAGRELLTRGRPTQSVGNRARNSGKL